ncbi:SCO3374 family protein [Streptomyces sp. NPDC017230]|uniref:SCO3374 family protein n=1 Tax=unclassified Streptomyces TaxID=2593676 RepID=UPI00379A6389
MAGVPPLVPFPRRPLEAGGSCSCPWPPSCSCSWERVRWWYEDMLGWPATPGPPTRLRVGVRFDVLNVPAEAGHAALERLEPLERSGPTPLRPGFPVAVRGERMLLLVAAGGADELPGLLEWLEWGSLPLDLTAVGAGGLMEAPTPPGPGSAGLPPRPPGRDGPQGAAVWLRPPEPGYGVEASLPTLSATGGSGTAPDLARLVRTLATQCHRVRLSPPSRFSRSPRLSPATR